jgi:predicted Zn-dependent peptidase
LPGLAHKELQAPCRGAAHQFSSGTLQEATLGAGTDFSREQGKQHLEHGQDLLYVNHYDSLETLIAKIEAFTPSRLSDLANQVFHPDNLSTLIYR